MADQPANRAVSGPNRAESDGRRRRPRPPSGLVGPGRSFWRQVVAEFDLRPDELHVLERACRVLDDLEVFDRLLGEAPPEVVGGNGQVALHPAWAERRLHTVLFARLVRQLGIPDPDDVEGGRPGPAPKPAHQRRRRNKVTSIDEARVRARWTG